MTVRTRPTIVQAQPRNEMDDRLVVADKPVPTNIAEGTALARSLVTEAFGEYGTDSKRYDELTENNPGFIGRFLASAEQKAVWEKNRLRTEMIGQTRVARLQMISETELRILATFSEALVKSTAVGITRHFHDNVQAEINKMAMNTEKHRRDFIRHIEDREATLATLGPRMRGPYERSMDQEISEHFAWFDHATSELIAKLRERAITYAGSIDG